MKRAGVLIAAVACLGASANDHSLIERAFAKGRVAELESEPIRIDSVRGERCESRLSRGTTLLTVDWQKVTRLELSEVAGGARLQIAGGLAGGKLIIAFDSLSEATPVLLAMERLQTACRPGA